MATSRSFGALATRLEARAKQLERGVERTVRRAAQAVSRVAISETPVKTGRSRYNWQVNFGNPLFWNEEPPGPTEAAPASIARNESELEAWNLRRGDIYLANGVPYINALNEGSSAQAPSGMTRKALMAGAEVVRNAKLLLR